RRRACSLPTRRESSKLLRRPALGRILIDPDVVAVWVLQHRETSPLGLGELRLELHTSFLEFLHGSLDVLRVEGDTSVPRLKLVLRLLTEVNLPARALWPDGDPVPLDRGLEAELLAVPHRRPLSVRYHNRDRKVAV